MHMAVLALQLQPLHTQNETQHDTSVPEDHLLQSMTADQSQTRTVCLRESAEARPGQNYEHCRWPSHTTPLAYNDPIILYNVFTLLNTYTDPLSFLVPRKKKMDRSSKWSFLINTGNVVVSRYSSDQSQHTIKLILFEYNITDHIIHGIESHSP